MKAVRRCIVLHMAGNVPAQCACTDHNFNIERNGVDAMHACPRHTSLKTHDFDLYICTWF